MKIIDNKAEEKPRLIEPKSILRVKSGTATIYFFVIGNTRGDLFLMDLGLGVILDHDFNHANHIINYLKREYEGFDLITSEEYELRIL